MKSNAGCWRRRLAALAIATSLLSGCATVGSDGRTAGTCPPVVEYSREFQARAADFVAFDFSPYPAVQAWIGRMQGRKGWAAAYAGFTGLLAASRSAAANAAA